MKTLMRYTFIATIFFLIHFPGYGQELVNEGIGYSNFQIALELFEKQKYEAAQHYMDDYAAAYVGSEHAIEAYFYAALCAVKLDRVDAEARLYKFVKEYPDHHKANLAYYELGNIYFTRQDYAKCIEYYLSIQSDQLEDNLKAELQYKLAYSYLSEKEFDRALEYFNAIKSQHGPYTAASNYYAGYLSLKKGDYKSALADLYKAGENEAYEAVVPYLILQVFYQSKRFEEVISYAKEIQINHPSLKNQEDIALITAEAYFFLKDYAAATQRYENYLYLQPTEVSDEVRYRLGYSLYQSGEAYKALKYLKPLALKGDELSQLASYYIGRIYIKIGQKNLALAAFDQARKLNFVKEIQPEASFQYAQLSYELGSLKVAIETLEKFKKAYPTNKHIPTVNHLLSQVYLHSNNYDLAIAHIEDLPSKSEDILKIYQQATFYKGNSCFNQENYEKAIGWLEKSLLYKYDVDISLQTHLWLAESYAAQQKYEQAIPHYQAVVKEVDKKSSAYYQDALYGLAYAYFNIGNYQQALPLFTRYTNLSVSNSANNWRSDAIVRTADCYYMMKEYTKALELYDKIQTAYPAHSCYQKALIYQILNKFTIAQQNLETIINSYTNTTYYEKALYHYAQLALQNQAYELAVKSFTNFIQKKPYSPLIPDALLNRAVASVNLKQYAEAGKDYETLLKEYPSHPNAQNALLELPKLVIQEGKPEKLQEYLASYKAANPGNHKLENINFETAKSLFYNQNYHQAIEYLREFILSYPNSTLLDEASFLIAEAYYRLGEDEKALVQYHITSKNKQSPFYNKVLLRIASISYKHKDFKSALAHYTELKERSTNKKETYYALEGMMKSSDALQQDEEVNKAASLIIKQGNITVNAVNQAALYLGKAAIRQDKKQEALQYFKQIVESGQDAYAAEAQYLIAQVYYGLGEYKQSLETLFTLNKQFNDYPEWINKGFLLMADNYIGLHELFQAKATLESIIENATDMAIVNTAKEKLLLVTQQIEADSIEQATQTSPSQAEDSEFEILDENQTT
jgi:TolA-binding protein